MNLTKLKTIIGKSNRQALQCVYYEGNKIIATDSYVLFRETQNVTVEKPFAINLNNSKVLDILYPDTNKIWPKELTNKVSEDMISIIHKNGILYYMIKLEINQSFYYYYFDKNKVDKSLSVFGREIWSLLSHEIYLHQSGLTHQYGSLIFKVPNQELLVLGVRMS